MKRFISLFATAALAISGLSPFATTVVHAEATQPDDTQFATAEQLKEFNTSDWDKIDKAAKVYFSQTLAGGTQKWWIAGNQRDGATLVLFADSLIEDDVVFEPRNQTWGIYKAYEPDSECTYYEGYITQTPVSVPARVRTNHYGTSQIRKRLKELENLLFTSAERNYLITSTIYTRDVFESRQDVDMLYYSTNDILYLPYCTGLSSDPAVYVGENNPSYNLLSGTLVVTGAYNNRDRYWTRKPSSASDKTSCVWYNGGWYDGVVAECGLQPAFSLDLTKVLFASAAHAATQDGSLAVDNDVDGTGAFTLRFKSDTLGAAEVAGSKQSVSYQGVPAGTYLVAQNSEGAWAKAVSGSGTVQASDMGEGFTSFENCQVWLETTDATQRITYATMASVLQTVTYDVTYEFVGADGQPLPEEVKKLLPASTIADEGSTVTPEVPAQTVVEVADGVWTFQGYDPDQVTDIKDDIHFTGTWIFSKNPAVTIAPASVTIYMGGDGYEGTVDSAGTSISGNEIVARYGFPEPGFLVTLPEALAGTDVSSLRLQYQDGEETAQWTFAPYGDSGNVYRITPAEGTQSRTVQVQFTDQEGNSIESLEAFDFSKYLNQTLTMKVYGSDVAQENVSILYDGRVYPVAVGEGATVTVRGTTADVRYGEVLENPGDTYAPMESGTAVPGAAVPVDTVFTINGSDVQVGADAQVSLLFDGIIDSNASADGKNYTQLLEEKVGQALADAPVTEGMERICEARYLDLVDENNGNVWVAAQDSQGKAGTVTVYWPLPEGTDKDTGFTVLHFVGLHRSMTPQQITGTLTDDDYTPEVIDSIRVTDTHVVFETTGFSPFVLTWETPKTSAPPEDGEDKEDPAPGVTPAPDQNKGQDSTDAPAEQTKSDTATAVAVIPRTADESRPLLWTALVVMSGAALAGLAVYRKKRSDK